LRGHCNPQVGGFRQCSLKDGPPTFLLAVKLGGLSLSIAVSN
jgi:hypothetical protein